MKRTDMRQAADLYDLAQRVIDRARGRFLRSSFAAFGPRSRLCGPLRLVGADGISIGEGVYVGSGCWLQGRVAGISTAPGAVTLSIGDRVSLSGFSTLSAATEVIVEDDALIARGVFICDHTHETKRNLPARDQGITVPRPVRIGRGAWIGQNAVILPGVTVGELAVVGANSVVGIDVPAGHLAAGAPARVIRPIPRVDDDR